MVGFYKFRGVAVNTETQMSSAVNIGAVLTSFARNDNLFFTLFAVLDILLREILGWLIFTLFLILALTKDTMKNIRVSTSSIRYLLL